MPTTSAAVLSRWTVISLRPSSQQAAVTRAIRATGATPLALPALRLAPAPEATAARLALRAALRCERVIFTSPAAVRFAAELAPLKVSKRTQVYALGAASARALARHGLRTVHPEAMHSEGLLALPEFARGGEIGLVTAPGGRGMIAAALHERGAVLQLAEVYCRLPPRFDRRHREALSRSRAPRAVLVTSAEALDHALSALPALRDATAVVSSVRLARLARERGFGAVIEADAPTPQALLAALAERVSHETARVLPVA